MDYLDLYLIHWYILLIFFPCPALTPLQACGFAQGWITIRQGADERSLPDLAEAGRDGRERKSQEYRNIKVCQVVLLGVSVLICFFSFNVKRIQNLTSNALKIQPSVLQVELNYFLPQPELIKVRIVVSFQLHSY